MNLELWQEYGGWALIGFGCFFIVTGSVGLLRMPDFFTRLHPAGITDSFGAPLVLLGVAVHGGFHLFSAKVMLLIIFLLITGPTATHALAKSAALFDLKPFRKEKK